MMNKIAIIIVGSFGVWENIIDYCKNNNIKVDIYDYPINTTEWEMDNELEHLVEFYDSVYIARPLPAHIRYEVIVRNEAINAKLFIPKMD